MVFGKVLPKIRARVDEDLSRRGLPREKVLAAIVRLLETTMMRIGNEEYAKTNKSYGLTTLRNRHVKVEGASRIRLDFRGKRGTEYHIDLRSKRLAAIVRRCQELPGQELFQYLDEEGTPRTVSSDDVNDYLREISGEEITAKDFRTWAATKLAALALQELEAFDTQTAAKKNVVQAVEAVSKMLGNTPAICRKCYIHPAILDGYLDGSLRQGAEAAGGGEAAQPGCRSEGGGGGGDVVPEPDAGRERRRQARQWRLQARRVERGSNAGQSDYWRALNGCGGWTCGVLYRRLVRSPPRETAMSHRPTVYGTRHAVSAGHYLAAVGGVLDPGGRRQRDRRGRARRASRWGCCSRTW